MGSNDLNHDCHVFTPVEPKEKLLKSHFGWKMCENFLLGELISFINLNAQNIRGATKVKYSHFLLQGGIQRTQ